MAKIETESSTEVLSGELSGFLASRQLLKIEGDDLERRSVELRDQLESLASRRVDSIHLERVLANEIRAILPGLLEFKYGRDNSGQLEELLAGALIEFGDAGIIVEFVDDSVVLNHISASVNPSVKVLSNTDSLRLFIPYGFLGLEPEIAVDSEVSGRVLEVLDLDPALGGEGPGREVFEGVDQE